MQATPLGKPPSNVIVPTNTSTTPENDVRACNETDAWWNMINCIVNFVSATTNLATNLETNHLNPGRTATKLPEIPKIGPVPSASMESEPKKQPELAEGHPKETDEACLPDIPQFVDELSEKIQATPVGKPPSNVIVPANSSTTPENLSEDNLPEIAPELQQESSQPEITENHQEKGDFNEDEDLASTTEPALESDEGVEQEEPLEEKESKIKDSPSQKRTEGNKLKTPSDDSCFFQEYSDSEQSLDISDVVTALDEKVSEADRRIIENVAKLEETTEKPVDVENPIKVEMPTRVEMCQQQIEEIKQILLSEAKMSKETEERALKGNEESISKTKKMNTSKSQNIQTNPTNRFKRTLRASIAQSPELQKPIKDEICKRKIKEKQPSAENAKAVPKNLGELKEQLDSIKTKSSERGAPGKKEMSPEKQLLDLTKRLAIVQAKNKTEKKNIPPDQTIKAPRSSVINVKKEIVAEKPSKSSAPKKLPKITKRYDSIESVVKKMIKGMSKTAEPGSRPEEQPPPPTPKQGATGKKQSNQQKQEPTPKTAPKPGARNRSSSRSSTRSKVLQKENTKKEAIPEKQPEKILLHKPKSKNVIKNDMPVSTSPRPRTSVKGAKNVKVTTDEKKKQMKAHQEVKKSEGKAQLSGEKTTAKSKLRPKSAT